MAITTAALLLMMWAILLTVGDVHPAARYRAWCGICGVETEHVGFRCTRCGR